MAQVNITNLDAANPFALDVTVGDKTVRRTIPIGGTVDVGDEITMDELNQSDTFKQLITDGKISVASEVESGDVAVEAAVTSSVVLGTPVVADVDRIVTAVQIADGAQTIAAQPDVPRNITMTLTDANDSVTATIVATGTDPAGNTVTETMEPDGAGGGKSLTGTKIFAWIDNVTVSNTAGSAAGDNLEVGVGNVIGLPTDIDAATAVKHTYLGGVRQASPTVAVGASMSGVDASGGTYDGSKLMHVIYNTGE